ncbi:MAG: hypothetical protein Q4F00_09660 [bacterium]|nr:hypothetical protein [bacterium]
MREGKHLNNQRGERRNMRGHHLSSPNRRRRLPAANLKYRQTRGKTAEKSSDDKEYRYFALWKPYGIAAKSDEVKNARPLSSFVPIEGLFPVGFLDADSEGLLLLTDNPRFRYGINHAKCQEMRIFLAQVELKAHEEMVSDSALDAMAEGVVLSDGKTLPLEVDVIETPELPERSLPVKQSKNTCWLAITCTEGWSKHIRRVTAALGYPTLRLVQWAMGPISLYEMTEGQLRELRQRELHWVNSVLERTPMPLTAAERSRYLNRPHRSTAPRSQSKRWAVKDEYHPAWSGEEKKLTPTTKSERKPDKRQQRNSQKHSAVSSGDQHRKISSTRTKPSHKDSKFGSGRKNEEHSAFRGAPSQRRSPSATTRQPRSQGIHFSSQRRDPRSQKSKR